MSTRAVSTLRADQKYHGKVREGSSLIESTTGTIGYQVMLVCDDGRTFYTIWITDKNRERAEKDFASLGVTAEQLQNPAYIEYQMGQDITDREIVFGTKNVEYKGKTTVRVYWIGKPGIAGADSDKASTVARFFGRMEETRRAQPVAVTHEHRITDDDIPF